MGVGQPQWSLSLLLTATLVVDWAVCVTSLRDAWTARSLLLHLSLG